MQGTGGQAWPRYGSGFGFGAGSIIKTTSFDPREFRLEGQSACGAGLSPVDWKVVRTAHNVLLGEVSLRMAAADDPWLAGTQLSGGTYRLFVWKFYP